MTAMTLEPAVLENSHVRLEPLEERHRDAVRPLADEAELWALTTVRADGPHFDSWFDAQLSAQRAGGQISHAVWVKAAGAYGGHTAFLALALSDARVEIGWTWYGAPFRGGVVNPACKHALMSRAFDAGALRVELKTHHLNQRSQRAMEKMGAVREGVLRSHRWSWTGERRDTVYYSVLADEWPNVRAGLEARL